VVALFAWDKLIFVIALLVGTALVVGAAFGLHADGTHGDAEASDGSAETDADHSSILALLGVGKFPLSVFASTLLFAFGGTGLCATALADRWLGASLARGLISLSVAGLVAVLTARTVAKLFARHLPSIESYATGKADLLGTIGVAKTAIGETFGVALAADSTGSLMQLKCRAQSGLIEQGQRVLVVDYDPKSDCYLVDNWEAEPRLVRSTPKGEVR
jgi:hypothetical protein